MKYKNVAIAGLGYALPPKILSSSAIEDALGPVYQRLGLHPGRLELMTGIKQRRYWPSDIKPSDAAVLAGQDALQKSAVMAGDIDMLIHASVCRDFLEPATASVVHQKLGLRPQCQMFDVSNACLGVATSMDLTAQLIESGSIESALIVAGEIGKPLVDATIEGLVRDENLTRKTIKSSFASLTIGSGAAAVLLTRADARPDAPRLLRTQARVATQHNHLCQGGVGDQAHLTMTTDAEALLVAGIQLAKETWEEFWVGSETSPPNDLKTITHQVGRAHTKMLYDALGLPQAQGFFSYETLGNVGSVSLPITLALAVEKGHVAKGDRVALLGIGSGLSCMMLEAKW
jgi:acyl-CoA:acyl-CoA alkyltransferase